MLMLVRPIKFPCVHCSVPAGALVWSADGALLALLTAKGVTIFDGDSEEQVGPLAPENAFRRGSLAVLRESASD